jgi:translin
MTSLKELAEEMLEHFEAKDRAREEAFKLSREVVRICSSSIRSVHRENVSDGERLMGEAYTLLKRMRGLLRNHPDIRYAGFVDHAEQEYAEARSVFSIITAHQILTPAEIDVELVNYLAGLGDTTGELRRHTLDLIRRGEAQEGEYFLGMMEEIYHLLMMFDYPDAINRGLRRKSDLARSMLERTRGDLTNAIEMAKVEASLRRLEDKLKE